MTQGLSRAQLGVTDEMVAAYGETIFALSNNLQTRRGDPVREKDFGAIEAHRHELGMGDAEIAARIGLTAAQVTLIRNLEERRRFRTGHYHVLNALGGGQALSRGTFRTVPGPFPIQRGGPLPAGGLLPRPGAGPCVHRAGLVGLRHALRLAPPERAARTRTERPSWTSAEPSRTPSSPRASNPSPRGSTTPGSGRETWWPSSFRTYASTSRSSSR